MRNARAEVIHKAVSRNERKAQKEDEKDEGMVDSGEDSHEGVGRWLESADDMTVQM